MRKTWNAFLGVILILAGAGGMIFSAAGIGSLWYFKPSIQAVITRDLTLLQDTLTTTSDGLALVSDSFQTTAASVRALEETIGDTAGAIRATTPMVSTITPTMTSRASSSVPSGRSIRRGWRTSWAPWSTSTARACCATRACCG